MTRHRTLVELARVEELEPPRRAAVRRHLADCPGCRQRLTFTRDVRAAAGMAIVDGAPPEILVRALVRRAAGDRVILPVNDPTSPPPGRRVVPVAIAAGGLVVAVLAAQLVRRTTREAAPPAPPADTAQSAVPPVGIAIIPGPGPTSVRVSGAGAIRVDVILHDGRELGVRGRGAAATARFGAGGGGITVAGLTGGALEVRIPRGSATRLFLNGRLELTSDGRMLRVERTGVLTDRATLDLPR